MYHDPVLYQRLTIAELEELYAEAALARQLADSPRRQPNVVRGVARGLAALLVTLSVWPRRMAQARPLGKSWHSFTLSYAPAAPLWLGAASAMDSSGRFQRGLYQVARGWTRSLRAGRGITRVGSGSHPKWPCRLALS
jgi:hypothetical protein